jgi:SAM-dependent methyltransferase
MRPAAVAPHHPVFAAVYDRISRASERYLAEHRRTLLARARGEVLELGAGTGANLAHYPDAVTRLLAAEPDPAMRRRLEPRLAGFRAPGEVSDAVAERLPFGDASFDTVVATLVLCSVEDPAAALAEARRVLRPDGALLLLEHVAAAGRAGRWQRRLQPVYGPLAGGCRLHRATERTVADAGFALEVTARFRPPGPAGRLFPHVVGAARRT